MGDRSLSSPNQVLTHAARAGAKQLNKPPRSSAREGLWLEQVIVQLTVIGIRTEQAHSLSKEWGFVLHNGRTADRHAVGPNNVNS